MRLSPHTLTAVWAGLQAEPFRAFRSLADEVETVLKGGNGKHGTDVQPALVHIEHAQKHFQEAEQGEGTDTETGCSHRAHGIARLLLAIAAACRKEG